MEVFSLLIDKAVFGGFLTGYTLKGRNSEVMTVSHPLFADDTLVFCRDYEDQMIYLSWILLYFEALFGLKVNLDKSAILLVGGVDNIGQLACELGCKDGTLPSTYLVLFAWHSAKFGEDMGRDRRKIQKETHCLEEIIHL